MTTDKIKQLADEYAHYYGDYILIGASDLDIKRAELHAAIDELVENERERCAKTCEDYAGHTGYDVADDALYNVAEEIRRKP